MNAVLPGIFKVQQKARKQIKINSVKVKYGTFSTT